MYQLYIANKNYSSWSLRPWVLMRELDIPFEERLSPFRAGGAGSNWSEFRRFSPSGRVPCLVDGERVVWESLAIVEYLAERHDGIWPADREARVWARCASAEMHAGFASLRERCAMNCGIRARLHDIPDALQRDMARLDELWRQGLERFDGTFLTGPEFTAVDAFFSPMAFRVQSHGLSLSEASLAYIERLLALPAMQRWYAEALRETWREPGHEEELGRYATLVGDMRADVDSSR